MKISVLDAGTLGDDLDLSPLREFGEVAIYKETAPELVAERVYDADIVMINKEKLNENTIGKPKNLRLIVIAATGYDNVDTEYMKKCGIGVCNVVGYSTDSVAQLTLSMALSLATHLPEYCNYVNSGKYSAGTAANRLSPVYHELAGKVWGIVGYGNIGKKVGEIAKAFGCELLVNKRTAVEGVNCVDIDTLCRKSDIISIHTPLNDTTRGLISKERIGLMKRSAILINVARGAVCDEEALCDAVLSGKLGGLGIDVYKTEPFPSDSPYTKLLSHPAVCLTPHMAWGSYEARVRCLNDMMESIRSFISGGMRSRIV